MSIYDHDPEVPAGFQEADLLQAQHEEESRHARALKQRGVCTHSWCLGHGTMNYSREEIEVDRQRSDFPDRPTDESITCQADIPVGSVLCLDCGQIIPDPLAGRR